MNQAVANRIGDAGFTDRGMPRRRRQLAGDERRASFAPIFDDLEEVTAFGISERCQEPVINRQQVELGQPGQESRIGPVAAAHSQFVKQARRPHIRGGETMAARALDKRGRQPAFPDPGGSRDQEIVRSSGGATEPSRCWIRTATRSGSTRTSRNPHRRKGRSSSERTRRCPTSTPSCGGPKRLRTGVGLAPSIPRVGALWQISTRRWPRARRRLSI
jgi:hypothetical protein